MSVACPICMEPFRNAPDGLRVARVLSCSNLVCTRCVREFRKSKGIPSRRVSDVDRYPCVTCRRKVHWTKLPACKTVAYLYSQIKLLNAANTENPKTQPESRKRARSDSDSISSTSEEMAAKMRKLDEKAKEVFENGSRESNSGADRNLAEMTEQSEEGSRKSEKKSIRIEELKEQFNQHYSKMNQILNELGEHSLDAPNVLQEKE